MSKLAHMPQLPLVPAPKFISEPSGVLPATKFRLGFSGFSPSLSAEVQTAWDQVANVTLAGSGLSVADDSSLPLLTLSLSDGFGPEAYELVISSDIRISAGTMPGLYNGLRTLAQLALSGNGLPQLVIKDEPRYAWRGLSLDLVRHWYGVDAIYRVIDLMAAYKFNVLHLHLTDDQGWRIEIPAYPALTELGSRSQVGGPVPDDVRAYLTLDEYREIQEYALARGITVVPEVDLPGHINAALHAIPELNPDGIATEPNYDTKVGISQLRVDNPATAPFITAVIKTFCENTLGDYVHIGGDEVPNLAADEYNELVTFANNVALANGKNVVAWQEAAHMADYPDSNTTLPLIQFWHPRIDPAPMVNAAKQGAGIILSPADYIYLDMKYDENDPIGLAWNGHVDLAKSRNWEPAELVPGLPVEQIVGIEGALWSETCRSTEDLLALIFPRLAAVADLAWTAPGNSETFIERLAPHAELWQSWEIPQISIDRLAAAAS